MRFSFLFCYLRRFYICLKYNCFVYLLLSVDFFSHFFFFQKVLSGRLSEFQMVWIQISTDVLSVLIWVGTVYKGCQQTTKVAANKDRVKSGLLSETYFLDAKDDDFDETAQLHRLGMLL